MSKSFGAVAPAVAIHLLDAACERHFKSWQFVAQNVITLGRAGDQDIEISDPYVSRNHAEFHFQDGRWVLLSKGKNGVLVNNQPVEQYALAGDTNFRLGPNGPSLRFETTAEGPASPDCNRTLCFDTLPMDFFGVDQHHVQREVEEIVEGDYFRSLQEQAAALRRRRET